MGFPVNLAQGLAEAAKQLGYKEILFEAGGRWPARWPLVLAGRNEVSRPQKKLVEALVPVAEFGAQACCQATRGRLTSRMSYFRPIA